MPLTAEYKNDSNSMTSVVPEGWSITEYKSFKVSGDESESSVDTDSEDEQIFAKSPIVRKPLYKKIVQKEELLPE